MKNTRLIFPALSWAGAPHYTAGVNRAVSAPKLDGKGDSESWRGIPALWYDLEDRSLDVVEGRFVKRA